MYKGSWPEVISSEFTIIKQLGKGAYSTVWEAASKVTGKKVAIKREEGIFEDLIDCKRILREIRLLRHLNHPNIVKLLDLRVANISSFSTIFLILELNFIDLRKVICGTSLSIQIEDVKTMFYDIMKAIKYIHSAGVLHRDIKPANILLSEDYEPSVCDFGLARSIVISPGPYGFQRKPKKGAEEAKGEDKHELPTLVKTLTSYVVTRWYRAPEIVLVQTDYGAGIDIWALGCVFAELLSLVKKPGYTYERKVLFPGTSSYPLSPGKADKIIGGLSISENDQLGTILNVLGSPSEEDCEFIKNEEKITGIKCFPKKERKNFQDIYPSATPEAINLLDKMLVFNPYKRINADECLNHPFFNSVRKKEEEIETKPLVFDFEQEGDLGRPRLMELFREDLLYYSELRKKNPI